MLPNNWNDLLSENAVEESLEDTNLDLDQIKKNIQSYSNEKLCDMIICDRYLGLDKQLSVICMEELASRRSLGDSFDFENYIDTQQKTLPVLDFSSFDIRSVLTQAINRKGSK